MPRALTISCEGEPQFVLVADGWNEARKAVDAVIAQLRTTLGDDWHLEDVREQMENAGYQVLEVSDYEPETHL